MIIKNTIAAAAPPSGLASVAGMVANFIIPGSGGLVAQAVEKGLPILQNVLALFNGKKADGLSDEAAAAAVAASVADQKAYIEKLARLDADYQSYLGRITEEDYKISTILKRAKIGGLDVLKAYADAVGSGAVNPDLLGVYKYLSAKGAAAAASSAADAAVIKPIPGQVTRTAPRFITMRRVAAAAMLGLSVWSMYWLAPAAEAAAAKKATRVNAAKKARAEKKAKAEAEAKKRPAVRRITKK